MKQLFTILSLLGLAQTIQAQWVTDSSTRNPLCTAANTQNAQQLCTDGNKGAYIVWQDYRKTPSGIYSQLVDSGGNLKWQLNGQLLTDTNNSAFNPKVATDGKGGAIVVWEQEAISAGDRIYATHLDKAGTANWKKAFLPIDTINDDRLLHAIPDGHGGIITDWYSYIYGTGDPNVVQWLDSTGRNYFPFNGLIVTDPNGAHYSADIVTDNNYHAYVVYYDYDTIRVQKIDTMGNLLWGKGGVILSTSYADDGSGHSHLSIADGNGGIIIGWDDNRFNPIVNDLFAQRLDTGGNLLWNPNGLLVDSSSSIYSHSYLTVNNDENYGAFFCFGYGHLFVQHVGAKGNVSWSVAEPVTVTSAGQDYPSGNDNGYNGVALSWDDGRGGGSVYSEEIDSTGKRLYGSYDAPVYTGPLGGNATGSQILSLKNHKSIAAFTVGGTDVYCARVPDKPVKTGIQPFISNGQLNVFPNPALTNIVIQASLLMQQISIIDIYGRTIKQYQVNNSQLQLNVKDLIPGIYFISVKQNNNDSPILREIEKL